MLRSGGQQRLRAACGLRHLLVARRSLRASLVSAVRAPAASRSLTSLRSQDCDAVRQLLNAWAPVRRLSVAASENKQERAEEQASNQSSTGTGKDRVVASWLFAVTGLVFGMVVLGGLTRLTKSGLSMTDWKFTGERPPSTQAEWEKEFERYKQFPEYKRMNRDMTVETFKFIYWMEWSHRMLGRAVGVAFGLPLLYFLARGRVRGPLVKPLVALFLMGGSQGLIGWWMVKSGLEEPEHDHSEPKVSPYRLAVHLISAFAIYSLLFSTALKTWTGPVAPAIAGGVPKRLRSAAIGVSHLIALTVFSGAFVAGNHAGLIYNEFPLMGGRLVPEDLVLERLPLWRNVFEHSTMVQFDHRVLGTSTVAAVTALWAYSRKFALSPGARSAMRHMLGMAWLQVGLGISTLLLHVPPHLAATHQAGALMLLTTALWTLQRLGPAQGSKALARLQALHPHLFKAAASAAAPAAAAAGKAAGASALAAARVVTPSQQLLLRRKLATLAAARPSAAAAAASRSHAVGASSVAAALRVPMRAPSPLAAPAGCSVLGSGQLRQRALRSVTGNAGMLQRQY